MDDIIACRELLDSLPFKSTMILDEPVTWTQGALSLASSTQSTHPSTTITTINNTINLPQ